MTEDCLAFFDGLLAGDGSIPKRKSNGRCRNYSQGCKHKEYLNYVRQRCEEYGITFSPISTLNIKDKRCKRGGYIESFLQSHSYKTFEILRKRWYDDRGVKCIPKDFRFAPDSLLQLYLSDGNFYRQIRLCVSGFKMSGVLYLQELIKKNLNISTKLVNSKGRGRDILIKKLDAQKFLNYIGQCPIDCYQYKWKDNESREKKLERNRKIREKYHLRIPGYYGFGKKK